MKKSSILRRSRPYTVRFLWSLGGFVVTMSFHFFYTVFETKKMAETWVTVSQASYLSQYIQTGQYLIGVSYALAAGFSLYALVRFIESQRRGVGGLLGGITLTGVLSVAGCFLLGCCGSPMLAVYLTLFGSSFLGYTKLLTFILTLASVVVGYIWMERNSPKQVVDGKLVDACCGEEGKCHEGIPSEQNDIKISALEKVEHELSEGMALAKCRKCGCMNDTLEALAKSLRSVGHFSSNRLDTSIDGWKSEMEPLKYACLGCQYCFPAVAMNLFNQAYPESATDGLGCAFSEWIPSGEAKERAWPPIAGEYKVLCSDDKCAVAISTLGSPELVDKIAAVHPEEVCIVGKTETENIGIDKIIKNTITNRTIRFVVLAGVDPKGHLPGQTIISLSANGVDEKMRVSGSKGKRPFLRNVTAAEIESFRRQVEVVDLIGCEDVETIIKRIKELPMANKTTCLHAEVLDSSRSGTQACNCEQCDDETVVTEIDEAPLVEAKEPSRIQMDRAGYFVVLPQQESGKIMVEHYDYGDKLLRRIEGKDARNLYWTIVENNWVTQLSHSAYLGKELTRAELSIRYGFKYVQDGA